jgi:hydrogenase maturation protein HypF
MYRLKVLVSGGVFQNRTLLEKLILTIPKLYFQNKTPINDGGIALGQLTNYLALQSE